MKHLRCFFYAMLASSQALPAASASTVLVAAGPRSVWQYLDAGQIAAPGWQSAAFDAGAWKAGAAPLGYGDPGLTTTLSFGRVPAAKPVTTYLRRVVQVADPARLGAITFDLRRDDGAVLYWNGVEILRSNMPAGAIGPATLAPRFVDGDEELEYQRFQLPAASLPLRAGANVLAVEVHQVGPSSSDLMFDLAVTGYGVDEPVPPDLYADAYAALAAGDAERAMTLLLQGAPGRAGYAQLAVRVGEVFLARGGTPHDPRYWRLLDNARAAAPDDMDTVYAWVRAHAVQRKDLPYQPARRPLPALADQRWRFIDDTPEGASGPMLTREAMLADIDDLELLLENCYAYLHRSGADYQAALDALRASIRTDLHSATFAHRLARMLTVFGDPHLGLEHPAEARIAVRFVMDGERVAALKSDRSALLDAAHPYVAAINGQPVADWLAAAQRLVTQASPQYQRYLALRQLREPGAVARQMGVPATSFTLTLAAADGASVALPVALGSSGPAAPHWPAHRSELRPDNLGYLRLASMEQGPAFVQWLDDWMTRFSGTRGLIIDVRGNGGGYQDALKTIVPWLMAPDSPLRIVNVAAFRLPLPLPTPNAGGLLGMGGRGLFPATSLTWSADEARQVRAFLANWKPAWQLPAGQFSDWHVMALRAADAHGSYRQPVIVLQDAEDLSATDNFLGALKGMPNVTLMGTASGGGSGRMADYTLPHSKFNLTLCQMASFAVDGATYDGNGVQPDVVAAPVLRDQLVGGGDSVLDAAVARLLKATAPPS